MAYSPTTVANYFLDRAAEEQRALTAMQLIKLVYIAHGWHLGYLNTPLIDEPVQAWKFGPVINSLYQHVKRFGSGPVVGRIAAPPPWLSGARLDEQSKGLLDSVWNAYKGFSGLQLSSMTHQTGTPWYVAWIEKSGHATYGAVISEEDIKAHYKDKIAKAPTSP